MSYADQITKSLFGRQIGLQTLQPAQSGGTRGPADFVVGPEALREGVTTDQTTAANLRAWGVSDVHGTSAASTPVYTLDPPIPGVRKGVFFHSTDSALYVKTATGCAIAGTSIGSSATAIRSSGGGYVELMGVTTALWAALVVSSSAVNGVAFQATT